MGKQGTEQKNTKGRGVQGGFAGFACLAVAQQGGRETILNLPIESRRAAVRTFEEKSENKNLGIDYAYKKKSRSIASHNGYITFSYVSRRPHRV